MELCERASSRCTLPRPACPHDQFQECRTPFQDQTWTCHLLQIQRVWNFFFPKEKILFCKMRGESVLAEPSRFHSLIHSPGADSAAWGKRERGSFPKAVHVQALLPHLCCQVTPSGSCRHHSMLFPAGSRWRRSQDTCSSPTNSPRGRPRTKRKYRKSRKA